MAELVLSFATTAALDVVWRYFVDAELLSSWHGHAERFEAWPGGRVRFADEGWDSVEGVVEVIEPQSRIEWSAAADASRIIETFDAVDGHTEVRIQQVGLSSEWPADGLTGRVRGWEESVADLVLILDHGVQAARHMTARADPGMRTVEVPAGLRVADVAVDGPADRVGVRPGDVLLSFDRVPIYRAPDLSILLRGHSAHDVVRIELVRDREVQTAEMTLR